MMAAVDMLCDQIAHNAGNEDVGREVLARANARVAHRRSQAVSQQLWERSGILVCNHSGHSPCCSAVLRWERRSPLKEMPRAVSL